MIKSLTFKEDVWTNRILEKPWYKELDKGKVLEFKPGLNILCGMNGSGKSTILEILAHHLAAEQGGESKVTNSWNYNVKGFSSDKGFKLNSVVEHDGQSILYLSSQATPGLMGSGFDEDFYMEGLKEVMANKASHGERLLHMKMAILHSALFEDKFPDGLENITDRDVKTYTESVDRFLKPSFEKGQKTILLDEPEEGLALVVFMNMVNKFFSPEALEKYQIIIATQHPYLALHPGANVFELTAGFRDTVCECITGLSIFSKVYKAGIKDA